MSTPDSFLIAPNQAADGSMTVRHGPLASSHLMTAEAPVSAAYVSRPQARSPLNAPGRLIANPTSVTASPNYGGTSLGLVKGVALSRASGSTPVYSEGRGNLTDVLKPSERWILAAGLRGWDDDALRLLAPDYQSEGAVTRHRVLTFPQSSKTGASALTRALTLLYVPDDVTRVPAIVMPLAVPDLDAGVEILLQRNAEMVLPVIFECLEGSNGVTLSQGMLPDLTLP